MLIVELAILAVCVPGGWWLGTRGPPPLAASVTGRVATWLIGGLCALAFAIVGSNIYISGYLLNQLHQIRNQFGSDLQVFVGHQEVIYTLRSTLFGALLMIGLAAVLYLLAPMGDDVLD